MLILGGVFVRHADDLQAVCFHFFVIEYANSSAGDGSYLESSPNCS
jgi:hypothetical protein